MIVCTATLFVYLVAVAEAVAVESTFFDDLFVIFQLEFTQVVVTVDFVHLEDFSIVSENTRDSNCPNCITGTAFIGGGFMSVFCRSCRK